MKALSYIFFFFLLFPYLEFINIGTDTQPNSLVFGVLLLFGLKDKKVNTPIILLWVLFGFSIILALTSSLPAFVTIKNVLNYLAPGLFCFLIYNLSLKTDFRISFNWFLAAIIIYLIVGLVQTYFIPDFMGFLVGGTRGIMFGGRGVVSLAPEPAFYGSMMLFFTVYSLLCYNRQQNMVVIPIMMFQLLFLSKTSTGIAILLVALGIFGFVQILRFNLKVIIAFSLGLLLLISSMSYMRNKLEDSRMGDIVEQVIEDPWILALVDQSVSVRLTSSSAPFISMKHNYWMPHGFGAYRPFIHDVYHKGHLRKMITPYAMGFIEKLGGGINMVCFHLGFLGIILPLAIYFAFRPLLYKASYQFAFILFICLLFTQMQLLNAIIGVIIGIALFKSNTIFEEDELALTES